MKKIIDILAGNLRNLLYAIAGIVIIDILLFVINGVFIKWRDHRVIQTNVSDHRSIVSIFRLPHAGA